MSEIKHEWESASGEKYRLSVEGNNSYFSLETLSRRGVWECVDGSETEILGALVLGLLTSLDDLQQHCAEQGEF